MPAGPRQEPGVSDKGLGSQEGWRVPCWRSRLQNQNSHYILNTELAEQSSLELAWGPICNPSKLCGSFCAPTPGQCCVECWETAGQASVLKELDIL